VRTHRCNLEALLHVIDAHMIAFGLKLLTLSGGFLSR